MKKIFFFLLLGVQVPLAQAGELPFLGYNSYSDTVSSTTVDYYDYFEALVQLKDDGIIAGYDDGTFRALTEINRAELLKILVLSIGVTEEEIDEAVQDFVLDGNAGFTDVDVEDRKSLWYVDYVLYAQSEGIVSGHPDGSFMPGDPVLLSELYKMVVESQYGTPDDSFAGEEWYAIYVNFLLEHGILEEGWSGDYYSFSFNSGRPGFTSDMDSKAFRGGAAELLYRMRIIQEGEELATYDPILSVDEYVEQYGVTVVEDEGTLSLQDPHFGYQFSGLPLGGVGWEDFSIEIQRPSGFQNAYSTTLYFQLTGMSTYSDVYPFSIRILDEDYYYVESYYGGELVSFACSNYANLSDSVEYKPVTMQICYDEEDVVGTDIGFSSYEK